MEGMAQFFRCLGEPSRGPKRVQAIIGQGAPNQKKKFRPDFPLARNILPYNGNMF